MLPADAENRTYPCMSHSNI